MEEEKSVLAVDIVSLRVGVALPVGGSGHAGRVIEDHELLARARCGDAAAVDQLFSRARPRLLRMVGARLDPRLRARVGASDILQEVNLEAIRRLDRYWQEPTLSFFLWLRFLTAQKLAQVCRFEIGAERRDVRREVPLDWDRIRSASDVLAPGLTDGALRPSQILSRKEREASVAQALAALEVEDREVLSLRHHEQLSNQEVAVELGLTPTAASKRYVRALDRLRARLESGPQAPSDRP
jgi:RNA polymerase sigma-70 factor (ECF subfamily)